MTKWAGLNFGRFLLKLVWSTCFRSRVAKIRIENERSIGDVTIGWNCRPLKQGCQMVYFQTKNPSLGKFWSVLEWKMLILCCHLVDVTVIWNILWHFGILYSHLVYFPPFWYVGPRKIWQPCTQDVFSFSIAFSNSNCFSKFEQILFFLF
jgi:hypothetical protein